MNELISHSESQASHQILTHNCHDFSMISTSNKVRISMIFNLLDITVFHDNLTAKTSKNCNIFVFVIKEDDEKFSNDFMADIQKIPRR